MHDTPSSIHGILHIHKSSASSGAGGSLSPSTAKPNSRHIIARPRFRSSLLPQLLLIVQSSERCYPHVWSQLEFESLCEFIGVSREGEGGDGSEGGSELLVVVPESGPATVVGFRWWGGGW
jgi:hypothetical protein